MALTLLRITIRTTNKKRKESFAKAINHTIANSQSVSYPKNESGVYLLTPLFYLLHNPTAYTHYNSPAREERPFFAHGHVFVPLNSKMFATGGKRSIMEWVSIKPSYSDGKMQATTEQAVFSLLTRAGFQLEQMRRGISGTTLEYFYFHPGFHIQVHEVKSLSEGSMQFFIFYPGGGTAFATNEQQLQQCIAAGTG